jgi:hypothetical protein
MHCTGLVADTRGAGMSVVAEGVAPQIGAGGWLANLDVVSDADELDWSIRAVT